MSCRKIPAEPVSKGPAGIVLSDHRYATVSASGLREPWFGSGTAPGAAWPRSMIIRISSFSGRPSSFASCSGSKKLTQQLSTPALAAALFCALVAKACTAPAPDAVCRGSVDGTDLAPVVEIRAVLPEQRQKHTVQLIKFKQAGQVIVCLVAKIIHRFAFSSNRPTKGHDLLLLYHALPKQKRGGCPLTEFSFCSLPRNESLCAEDRSPCSAAPFIKRKRTVSEL